VFLLLAFADDDEKKRFEYLYGRYKNLLFRKTYDILRDHMLAEDAVSEAYLRIYRNIHKIDDPDSPRSVAFMVTIARNAALSMLRRSGRGAPPDNPLEEADGGYSLEGEVISAMSAERIYEIIAGVDEELRNIFVLKFAYGMSHREIAQSLGISENGVTVKLHRAKKKVAALLSEEGGFTG
jgi:RNA polymerase sigma-70 factor (ECF subfamily)